MTGFHFPKSPSPLAGKGRGEGSGNPVFLKPFSLFFRASFFRAFVVWISVMVFGEGFQDLLLRCLGVLGEDACNPVCGKGRGNGSARIDPGISLVPTGSEANPGA